MSFPITSNIIKSYNPLKSAYACIVQINNQEMIRSFLRSSCFISYKLLLQSQELQIPKSSNIKEKKQIADRNC